MTVHALDPRLHRNTPWQTTSRLPELVAFYLKWHQVEGHTPTTVAAYRKNLSLFLRDLESRGHTLEIPDITPMDVLEHLDGMKSRGRSPRYLRSRYQCIDTFLSWAVRWKVIDENPAAILDPPKVPKTRKPFLKPEALRSLLAACEDGDGRGTPSRSTRGAALPKKGRALAGRSSRGAALVKKRRAAMIWLLATTGLRRKEMHELWVEDLDWRRELVRIRLGKGQKERYIPMVPETQRALSKYLGARVHVERHELWVTRAGNALGYWGIGQDLNRLAEKVGVADQLVDVCHIFRRTWAANAVRQGIPAQYIRAVAGWEDGQMLDSYTRAMQEEEGAVEAFRTFDPFADWRAAPAGE